VISSFVKKMASQVCKDNNHYLLTKHLVCSVFTKWQMGQAVAQFLKGGNEAFTTPCLYPAQQQQQMAGETCHSP
jgi:hypothetical protein